MELWLLYLIFSGLPSLREAFFVVSAVCMAGMVCSVVAGDALGEEMRGKVFRYIKRFFVAFLIVTPLAILMPTREDLIKIVGLHYITNVEGAADLVPNMVETSNNYMELVNEFFRRMNSE